jgi:hypothetical protein
LEEISQTVGAGEAKRKSSSGEKEMKNRTERRVAAQMRKEKRSSQTDEKIKQSFK